MTELDIALHAALENSNQANFFFDAFLNASVWIPAQRADETPGAWTGIEASDRFFPLYLRKAEAKAVPVFDSLEKLKTWADERAFDFMVLPAHLFIKVLAEDVGILLNEGTPFHYHFTPKTLGVLRTAAKTVEVN